MLDYDAKFFVDGDGLLIGLLRRREGALGLNSNLIRAEISRVIPSVTYSWERSGQ